MYHPCIIHVSSLLKQAICTWLIHGLSKDNTTFTKLWLVISITEVIHLTPKYPELDNKIKQY